MVACSSPKSRTSLYSYRCRVACTIASAAACGIRPSRALALASAASVSSSVPSGSSSHGEGEIYRLGIGLIAVTSLNAHVEAVRPRRLQTGDQCLAAAWFERREQRIGLVSGLKIGEVGAAVQVMQQPSGEQADTEVGG